MKIYHRRSGRLAAFFAAGIVLVFPAAKAVFAAPPVKSLSVIVEGNGRVEGDAGVISCPGACDASYKKASLVTLSATAGADSRFAGWTGDCAGTQSNCTVKMRDAARVTAVFETVAAADPVDIGTTDVATDDSLLAGDQPVAPDDTEVQMIRIGWPVFSGQ